MEASLYGDSKTREEERKYFGASRIFSRAKWQQVQFLDHREVSFP